MVGWGKTAEFSLKGGRHFSLSEVAVERVGGWGGGGQSVGSAVFSAGLKRW